MSESQSQSQSQVELKIHRIRFFKTHIYSINSMCYNEMIHKLALIRRRVLNRFDGQLDTMSTIEIWNFANKSPFIEQIINDDDSNPTLLESILWTKSTQRLFSCGLNSYLNEYDLNNSRIKRSYAVTSGGVWCSALDANHSLIACGTEDGYISVFAIKDEQLELEKMMDRNDKRILCVAWHRTNDNTPPLIISGSIDVIKIWNYQTGRCIDYIKLGDEGVIVWCLAALDDFTIVSGDSGGNTCFWNGNTATLITSNQTHKADVLSLCVSSDQLTVYSAGVDPIIVQFNKTFNKFNSWVNTNTRHMHTHDVRALACVEPNWVLSGGIDTYLMRSCYPPNLQLRYFTDFSRKVKVIKNYVLLQYEQMVQIWKLGNAEDETLSNDDYIILNIDENAVKLIEIKSKRVILSSCLNQSWVAYANYDNIKLMTWSDNNLVKVPVLYKPVANCSQMAFCADYLLVVCGTRLHILKLDNLGVILHKTLEFDGRIYSMSSSDKFLAICIADNRKVSVYTTKKWKEITSFKYASLPTAMEINPFNEIGEIWLAYANNKLLKFEINENKITKSLYRSDCFKPEDYQPIDEYWSVKQIAFANNSVLFSDDNMLYKLDIVNKNITKCEKYRHIIKLTNQNLHEIVIVEITPEMLFNCLPKALDKKKFAT